MDIQKIKLKDYKRSSDILYKDYISLIDSIKDIDPDTITTTETNFINKRVLKIFYDIDSKLMRQLTLQQIDLLVSKINEILKQDKPELKRLFEYDGKLYGFIPNFSECNSGEIIDAEDCYNSDKIIELTSILYREVEGKVNKKGENVERKENRYEYKEVELPVWMERE